MSFRAALGLPTSRPYAIEPTGEIATCLHRKCDNFATIRPQPAEALAGRPDPREARSRDPGRACAAAPCRRAIAPGLGGRPRPHAGSFVRRGGGRSGVCSCATNAKGADMAGGEKVVVNLATGLEDAEKVTIAFLVAVPPAERGKQVTMFLTKDAVRLALPGGAEGVACDGCPPLERLFEQFAEAGGELLVCPICFNARKLDEGQLVANATIGGATPLWDLIGDDPVTVLSY